jgi:hypothetical protein
VEAVDVVTWGVMIGTAVSCFIMATAVALWVAAEVFGFNPVALWRERANRRIAELKQREATARAEAHVTGDEGAM